MNNFLYGISETVEAFVILNAMFAVSLVIYFAITSL